MKKEELRVILPQMEESLSEIEADLDEITNELRGDDTVEIVSEYYIIQYYCQTIHRRKV